MVGGSRMLWAGRLLRLFLPPSILGFPTGLGPPETLPCERFVRFREGGSRNILRRYPAANVSDTQGRVGSLVLAVLFLVTIASVFYMLHISKLQIIIDETEELPLPPSLYTTRNILIQNS